MIDTPRPPGNVLPFPRNDQAGEPTLSAEDVLAQIAAQICGWRFVKTPMDEDFMEFICPDGTLVVQVYGCGWVRLPDDELPF